MSKFRVRLTNSVTGRMDPTVRNGISAQRTMYVSGPKGIIMHFKDGQIFEDSNYWKQHCQPYCKAEDSFLELLEDDGSVYSENSKFPFIFNKVIEAHSKCNPKYSIDIHKQLTGIIASAQITNRSLENSIHIKFNKSDNAVLEFMPGETQTFNQDDFSISNVDFINDSTENIKVQILVSVISSSKT